MLFVILFTALIIFVSSSHVTWATQRAYEICENKRYIGPELDTTCSRINGEVIIDYNFQKIESTFVYNGDVPWCGPQMELVLKPNNRPGEFILNEDIYGKHLPTGIQITHSLFDVLVRKSSRIFLRFKRGTCVHFRVHYE